MCEAHDDADCEFGLRRLQDLVREHRNLTAKEIGKCVLASGKWGGGEDDRTIVIVKAVAP